MWAWIIIILNFTAWAVYFIFFAKGDLLENMLLYWFPYSGVSSLLCIAGVYRIWFAIHRAEILSDVINHHTDGKWR